MTTVRLRYIDRFKDRHGKERHYVRPPGCKRVPLPGKPGSPEFMDAYRKAVDGASDATTRPKKTRGAPGTIERLAADYLASTDFLRQKPDSKRSARGIIDRFVAEHGHRLVVQMRHEHVAKIVAARSDTPAAANNLLKRIRVLMRFAIKMGWRTDDPTIGVTRFKDGSFHTWTEDEVAAFEKRWPIGSRERTAFALHLFTGQRRSDVVKMTWRDYDQAAGTITVAQEKGDQERKDERLTIPVHPALREALAAWKQDHVMILTTSFGKPFAVAGYGNWLADMIDAADLPEHCVPHGLRKAAARRLAEAGCSAHEIQAITGHKTLKEVERYTAAVRQVGLAQSAVVKMTERFGDKNSQTS
ncbi:MAG TPA: site-specific integrase [Inquilinus sp.]